MIIILSTLVPTGSAIPACHTSYHSEHTYLSLLVELFLPALGQVCMDVRKLVECPYKVMAVLIPADTRQGQNHSALQIHTLTTELEVPQHTHT